MEGQWEGWVSIVGGNRLLIVEDDLATLYALRTLFGRRGWEVSTSRTLAEGLAAVDASDPDWVIVDLWLPDGDGEELVRHVREGGRRCWIAVVSGVLDPDRVARFREWKTDVVMSKPIDFVKLYEACLRTVAEAAPHADFSPGPSECAALDRPARAGCLSPVGG
jgi:DNA-binding response OmpR family regulator